MGAEPSHQLEPQRQEQLGAPGRLDAAEVDEFRYFLTRQQAMVLGNYLCKASGLTIPPPRRRGLLSWMRRGD